MASWSGKKTIGYDKHGNFYQYDVKAGARGAHKGRLYQNGNQIKRYEAANRSSDWYRSYFEGWAKATYNFNNFTSTYTPAAASGDEGTDPTAYGSTLITRDDFFDTEGKRVPFEEIKTLINEEFPDHGFNDSELNNIIQDQVPPLKETPQEEIDFVDDAYSLSADKAEFALEKDLYGIQQKSKDISKARQNIYTGNLASQRTVTEGLEDMSTGFDMAVDKYDIAMDAAESTRDKGLYDLDKDRFDETEFRNFLKQFATAS